MASMPIGWKRSAVSSMATDVIWADRKNPASSRVFTDCDGRAPDQVNDAVKRWMRVQASSSSVSEVA